jgi:hypothetical protein
VTPTEPVEPDEMEILRAKRGEGWEWNKIQSDPCPQCGDDPASIAPSALGALVVERADAWRGFLVDADDAYLRTNPEPGVFSPIQYAAHVRGILTVYTDRMVLGLEQEAPTVPLYNPGQAEWDSYNQLGRDEVAGEIETQGRRLAETIRLAYPEGWARPVINDRGVYGVYTFTVGGLACNATHETYHHLLDATGTLTPS